MDICRGDLVLMNGTSMYHVVDDKDGLATLWQRELGFRYVKSNTLVLSDNAQYFIHTPAEVE